MRIQPRTKEPKKQVSARTIRRVSEKIESTARKFNCSKSFVINTMLADAFGIKVEWRYDD